MGTCSQEEQRWHCHSYHWHQRMSVSWLENYFLHLLVLIILKSCSFFNTLSFSVHQQHMITVYTNTSSVRTPKHGTTSPLGGDSEYMVMSQVLLSGPVKRYRGSSWGISVSIKASVACDVLTVALYGWTDSRITLQYRYGNQWQYRHSSMQFAEWGGRRVTCISE